MARAMWILAIAGSIGLFVKLGTAQERADDGRSYLLDQAVQRHSFQYFPRGRRDASSTGTSSKPAAESAAAAPEATPFGTSDTQTPSRYIRRPETKVPPTLGPQSDVGEQPRRLEPIDTIGEIGSADSSANRRRDLRQAGTESSLRKPNTGDSTAGVTAPAGNKTSGGTSAETEDAESKSSQVIHAEYQQAQGASERRKIQQVRSDKRNVLLLPKAQADETSSWPTNERGALSQSSGYSADLSLPAGAARSHQAASPLVTARWVKRSPINVGQECECHLIVKNAGGMTAKEVVVDGYFPASVRLTKADPQPIENGDHLSWQFASLSPGDEQVIRVRMIPSQRGELATTARVRFTEEASVRFDVEEPLLKVSMQGPKQVMLGDPASQIILVSNPGTGVATNVTVEAMIPQGLEHPRGERLLMEIGALNPGESRTVRLALAAIEGGEQTLNVKATADAGLKQQIDSVVEVVAPKLTVNLEGPSLRYLGRSANYVLTVTNDGAGASNNVQVMETIPEGFRFLRAVKGGQYDDLKKTTTWFVGRMEPGESRQVSMELAATRLGSYVHHARAVSEHSAVAEAQLKTMVDGTASLVLEVVDLDDPVEIGTETAYEVRIRNEGSKAAQTVGLSCETPQGVELLDAAGPTAFVANQGRVEFKPLKTLPAGKTAIYRVQVRGTIGGNRRFRAHLTSDSIQEPLTVEELTRFYGE